MFFQIRYGITRIQSLLSSFHLDNRIVSTNNIYEEQDAINWHEINAKLRRRREESFQQLSI